MQLSPLEAIQEAQGVDAPLAEDAIAYLAHYGYLAGAIASAAINPVLAVYNLAAALMDFQNAAGIPATGQIDDATKAKMAQPRCGVLDVMRLAEFARWRKNRLTYTVQGYVSGLSQADQMDLIAQAWKQWSDHADIVMTPATGGTADIVISTGRGRAQGFDGSSGTLAWAYLPNGSDGQLLMRFDLDESWGKETGIRYLNVACHEFGHLLGLDHSRVSSALMAPYYSPGVTKPQANDDVSRIVALYGKATAQPPPTPTDPAANRVAVVIGGKYYRANLVEAASMTEP